MTPARMGTGPEGTAAVDFRLLVPLYVLAHLALDQVSFIHELPPLNITPWNPPSGLLVATLIAFGPRMIPIVWLALVVSDAMVRGMPVPLWPTLFANAVIACTYGAAVWLLTSRLGLGSRLERLRDIVLLMGASVLASALVGVGYISVFTAIGLFPWGSFALIFTRYWIGEMIGIVVLAPFALVWMRPLAVRWDWRKATEFSAQGAAIALALWADFGPLASEQYEYFYLLFLPVVWVATRHGLAGATAAALVTQVGLIVAIQVTGVATERMTHFQYLMLALTATTLLLGAVVSERRRVEAWVRERQAEFAHASRLTEAGEMTAALAHEINQPLAATMSYARAARKIAQRDGVSSQLAEIIDKTVAQAERADRVMRSLREFVRKGDTHAEPVDVATLVADSVTLASPVVRQHGATVATDLPTGLPPVFGNAVQLQQVLLNLLRNAAEAMAEAGSSQRLVTVSVRQPEPGFLELSITDTGPGLAELVERNLFSPFFTTKPTGMGLGLSIARSIIEAHGGVLNGRRLPSGGSVFSFSLPLATHHDDHEPG